MLACKLFFFVRKNLTVPLGFTVVKKKTPHLKKVRGFLDCTDETQCLKALNNSRYALAATHTGGNHAVLLVAAFHFIHELYAELCACAA